MWPVFASRAMASSVRARARTLYLELIAEETNLYLMHGWTAPCRFGNLLPNGPAVVTHELQTMSSLAKVWSDGVASNQQPWVRIAKSNPRHGARTQYAS